MCYVVLLSTSSPDDLSVYNTELVRYARDHEDEPSRELLENSHRWYVGSKTGCSCGFRHVTTADLGFSLPENWMPEDNEDIEATREFFTLVRKLAAGGAAVDCVSAWYGTPAAEIRRMDVPLSTIQDGEFRFFENYRFVFS